MKLINLIKRKISYYRFERASEKRFKLIVEGIINDLNN